MCNDFHNLSEASRWWHVTQHFVIRKSPPSGGIGVKGLKRPRTVEGLPCEWWSRNRTVVTEQFQGYLVCLRRWQNAFNPIYKKSLEKKEIYQKAYIESIALRILSLTLYTDLYSPSNHDVDAIFSMTSIFTEIIELSSIVLEIQHQGNPEGEIFTIENGPTWPLFHAAGRCRDPSIRERAIDILKLYPRRDGLWDSETYSRMAGRNIVSEMENAADGSVDEQYERFSHRGGVFDELCSSFESHGRVQQHLIGGLWRIL
jgi:hypothetical protein